VPPCTLTIQTDLAWFTSANLAETKLSSCSLQQASLAEARLQDALLTSCDLSGADLRSTGFHDSRLFDRNFSESGPATSAAPIWRARSSSRPT
jgi:uncharacterized protein YjbI with pentapeptide repeats